MLIIEKDHDAFVAWKLKKITKMKPYAILEERKKRWLEGEQSGGDLMQIHKLVNSIPVFLSGAE